MLQVSLDFANDNFREVLRQEIKNALGEVLRKNQHPPFLTRTEMMEMLRIGETKAAELMKRPDFPVCREAGVLIPTHMLFKWVESNTRWLQENSNYFDQAI